ncbi:hypothetical protein F5146DRAFT_1006432 [Armillaria mellea]|nr:hypothetical protein F5146DRAFT_1006432 [Armillaria mellea]
MHHGTVQVAKVRHFSSTKSSDRWRRRQDNARFFLTMSGQRAVLSRRLRITRCTSLTEEKTMTRTHVWSGCIGSARAQNLGFEILSQISRLCPAMYRPGVSLATSNKRFKIRTEITYLQNLRCYQWIHRPRDTLNTTTLKSITVFKLSACHLPLVISSVICSSKYDWVSTSSHSPELDTLVTTNTLPTTFQAAQLKASIDDLDAPITEIQSEVDVLLNTAASLEARITRLKDVRRDYRAALSPIRGLPTEILVEILHRTAKEQAKLTAAEPHHVFGFNVFKITDGPWQLGQVCRSWRGAVEVLCPEMWSTLAISWQRKLSADGEGLVSAPKKNMLALLNCALERGQSHHLNFFFRCRGFHERPNEREDEPEEMSQCFDLLLKHSQRWGSIELAIVPSFLRRLSRVRGRIDRIEDVYLMCAPTTMPGTVDAFAIAPKLKTFDLIGMNANVHIPFPVENLVSFADARPLPEDDTVPEYLAVIALAPNLSDFSYRHYSVVPESPWSISSSDRTPITSNTLSSDEDAIACPRDALFHLHNLVLRSQCSLTTLSFIDATMDDNLLPILQLSPQLVSLSFEDREWTGDSDAAMQSIFIAMAETIQVGEAVHHTLIPILKNLEIVLQKVEFDSVGYLDMGFVEMIVGRRDPPGLQVLESLRILVEGRDFGVGLSDDGGLEELKRLGEGGLHLHLDLDDWEERVLEARRLPFNPDHH